MKLQIFKGDLTILPVSRQKKICQCRINEAREHALTMLRMAEMYEEVHKRTVPTWDDKDEQYIRDYIKKHGRHKGFYREIGLVLGRSRDSVEPRIRKMQREGRLKGEAQDET